MIPPSDLPLKGGLASSVSWGSGAAAAAAAALGRQAPPPQYAYACILRLVSRDKVGNVCQAGGALVTCGFVEKPLVAAAQRMQPLPRQPSSARFEGSVDVTDSGANKADQAAATPPRSPTAAKASSEVGPQGGRSRSLNRSLTMPPGSIAAVAAGDTAGDDANGKDASAVGLAAEEEPAAADKKACTVHDEGDGTYTLTWSCKLPGHYEAFVRMDGLHVIGSPCALGEEAAARVETGSSPNVLLYSAPV